MRGEADAPRLRWQLLGDGCPRGEAMVAQRMVVPWDSGGGRGGGRGPKRGVGAQSGDPLGFSWWVGAHSQEGEAEGSGVALPTSHPASLLSARRLPEPQQRGDGFLRTSGSALTSHCLFCCGLGLGDEEPGQPLRAHLDGRVRFRSRLQALGHSCPELPRPRSVRAAVGGCLGGCVRPRGLRGPGGPATVRVTAPGG